MKILKILKILKTLKISKIGSIFYDISHFSKSLSTGITFFFHYIYIYIILIFNFSPPAPASLNFDDFLWEFLWRKMKKVKKRKRRFQDNNFFPRIHVHAVCTPETRQIPQFSPSTNCPPYVPTLPTFKLASTPFQCP